MKIILTGSLGHISRPLAQQLLNEGHHITVISSKANKQQEIEALGAVAAIGSVEDPEFLTTVFAGADAVYTMVPPNNYFDAKLDLIAYYHTIGRNYTQAIKQAGVKRVVNLSTIGGHLASGNGILRGAHGVEQQLNTLAATVKLTHIRPTSFYYNLLGYIEMIKKTGMIAVNYGLDQKVPWVSPLDIAAAVAEELVTEGENHKIRYVASEERSGNDVAAILGAAIGKPDLQWVMVSDETVLNGLVEVGMNPTIAAGLVEMYAALNSGLLAEDYVLNKPVVMGKVKLSDFAKEFALAFEQKY